VSRKTASFVPYFPVSAPCQACKFL
jgi:hypothetical protein